LIQGHSSERKGGTHGIDIETALKKLESLIPEEWKKLREKIDADIDKETEEESKKVLREYAKRRNTPTQDK
jgi:hypothetical protein